MYSVHRIFKSGGDCIVFATQRTEYCRIQILTCRKEYINCKSLGNKAQNYLKLFNKVKKKEEEKKQPG